jgi:O6-methylguanine-DNA--protein-cysteine methyltransferase
MSEFIYEEPYAGRYTEEKRRAASGEGCCEICDTPVTLGNLGVFPKTCIACSKDVLKALKEIERGEVVTYEV